MVRAVAAFSPGEYFKKCRVADVISTIRVPIFATGARDEIDAIRDLLRRVPKRLVSIYQPSAEGRHGARVLWQATAGHDGYWTALLSFLESVRG
jgi:hypothetical protein